MTVQAPQEGKPDESDKPIFLKTVRFYFREYCNCSSIHGFRYFGEKRTYFERTWWFIVFCLVVAMCAYQITMVYNKWNESPVIVSFDTRETPIYSIPFPAVTICPEIKSNRSLYSHSVIAEKLATKAELTETEKEDAQYMSMLCDSNSKRMPKTTFFGSSDSFFEFIDGVSAGKFMRDCSWMGYPRNCDDLFEPIITDEGICYTFNMLSRKDLFRDDVKQYENFENTSTSSNWNVDEGYMKASLDAYPRRANYPGVRYGLHVTLTADKENIDPTCRWIQGFRGILHAPMRIPRPSNQYFRIPLNEAVLGSIQPVKISTSTTVKDYLPERRLCYFSDEKYLGFFKIYTQLNCQLECLTNFTLKVCNCVNFFMPRKNGTKICGPGKKTCMRLAEQYLQARGVSESITMADMGNKKNKDDKKKKKKDTKALDCGCKPLCSDVSYSLETSQSKWDWQERFNVLYPKRVDKYKNSHRSQLTLYFKASQFVTSKREELYGPTDFLANFGGLLGLFTGFSVLSVMEVIYFLTIRLCCNYRLYGKWYGPQ